MVKFSATFLCWIFLLVSCQSPIEENDGLLLALMKTQPDKFKRIIDQKDPLEVQIIYTQINRDANNVPTFRSFYFNVDSTRYFYPASTVKLPMVLLALEKLNELNVPGLTKYTPMF
ncbi:MAG: class A beta-lactamase-related serine hydrolase, partial [Cyclobacteriaceae bacterium]|nr:class A beta-lactamase-related serine hydrolase [Cyclobacteriaceae bacterium]